MIRECSEICDGRRADPQDAHLEPEHMHNTCSAPLVARTGDFAVDAATLFDPEAAELPLVCEVAP